MKEPWLVIEELEKTSGRNDKIAILERELKEGNVDLFEGFKYCLNPYSTFGIKKIPVASEGYAISNCTFPHFVQNANLLISREITGNKALELVAKLAVNCHEKQWNYWYRRILLKDLKCGLSEKTINKVVEKTQPHFVIDTFSCQLASPSEEHEKKMIGKKIIDVKMDGARVLTFVYPDGRVEQFSRNGKEIDNFPTIVEQFKKYCKYIGEALVLDGEVMSSSFQDLMKQLHRKENVQTSDASLFLFDIILLKNFVEGKYTRKQFERFDDLDNLINILKQEDRPNIKVIDREIVDLNTQEGKDSLKKINNFAIENGFEGIMIKDFDAPYECKRTTSWLKLKPSITVDLTVVDVEEGTGKNVGKLGALVCEGFEGSKFIKTNAGSGFADEQREEFWLNKNLLIGKVVEIKADAITKAQDSEDSFSLRFPRFVRFREDKE